jgi:hypothetical protein
MLLAGASGLLMAAPRVNPGRRGGCVQAVFVIFYLVAAQMLVAVSVVVANQDVTFGTHQLLTLLVLSTPPRTSHVYSSGGVSAAGVGAGVVAISQLFGGYLIHLDNLLPPLQWLSWFSYLRYGFQAALRIEMGNAVYNQHQFAEAMLTDESHQQWLQTLLVLIPQNLEGKEIIAAYDYFPHGAWTGNRAWSSWVENLGFLVAFLVVFHYITYATPGCLPLRLLLTRPAGCSHGRVWHTISCREAATHSLTPLRLSPAPRYATLVTTHGCYKPRKVMEKTKHLMSACAPTCFPISSNPSLLPISPGSIHPAYDIEASTGTLPVARPPPVRRTTTVAW